MGKLFILIGKSATGKDTLYKMLMERFLEAGNPFQTVVSYTTRPIRQGEQSGVEYFFVTLRELEQFCSSGRLIEQRTYHTVHGDWHYFTVDDGQIDFSRHNYLLITTLAGYEKLRDYYGADRVIPLYIEAGDRERLLRSVRREDGQEKPSYAEVCRRYLADEADFSEAELARLSIRKRYLNEDLEECARELEQEICKNL